MNPDDHRKHLEFIQGIITRMASNSFLIRGWSITLVSALFALAAKDANPSFVAISLFTAAMFWVLDGYYLSQERKFRALYDQVRENPTGNYSLRPPPSTEESRTSWCDAAMSETMGIFHGTILLVILIVLFVLHK